MELLKKLCKAISSNRVEKVEIVFEEIYYTYSQLVAFIIAKYVDRKEDIEELVDDVFLSFYKALFKTDINNIKYYLVVLSKNTVINFMKRKQHKLDVIYNEEFIYAQINKENTYYDLICDVLKVISEEELNIILLHLLYNYKFEDIAVKLSKPLPTIVSIYRRAIKKFNKEI